MADKASAKAGKSTKKSTKKSTRKPKLYRFECSEVLDISSAAQLQSSLLKALESQLPIELVAVDVERADTTALQILTAFFQDARAQGVVAKWVEPSDALCQSARLLGLLDMIQLQTNTV